MAAGSTGRRLGLLATVMVTILLLPTALAAIPAHGTSAPATGSPSGGSGAVSVTWNGANISSAGSTSSAFSVASSEVINVSFRWSPATVPAVADARLQMFYLGFAVATSTVSPLGAGIAPTGSPATSAVMNWTVGWVQYAVEGTFRLTASLVASNGSTLWSQDFYVRLVAPAYLLAGIPLLLVILGLVELYALFTAGAQAGLGRRPPAPPGAPAAAPPGSSDGATTPPPSEPNAPPGGPA